MITPLPPPFDKSFLELVKTTINEMLKGRGNNVGSFTLTENAASTTLTDNLLAADMVIAWTPTTANAAAELATMYVSARNNGSFTITHANNAQTDRTFLYIRAG